MICHIFENKKNEMCFWPSNLKDWVEVMKSTATLFGLIIGGWWAWWQFKLFREKHSKMELFLDVVCLGRTSLYYFIELQGVITKKGKRSQTLS